MKKESEKVIVQTAEFDKEIRNCAVKEKMYEAAMKELELKIQKSTAVVNKIHNHEVHQQNQPIEMKYLRL